MTAFALSAEVLHKTDTTQENQSVSDLVRAGLAEFINFPDLNHTVVGINSETSLPVRANFTLSLDKEYTCATCESAIMIEERHVVIAGIYSRRLRDNKVFDHHHLHTSCFHQNELPFWDQIATTRVNKKRHHAIVERILQSKARRKPVAIAA